MAATLVVRRDSAEDIKIRGMDVYVDNEWKLDLQYGHSYEIELPPGDHTLAVSNKLKKSEEPLVLRDGETAVFQATNVMSKGVSVVLMGLGMVMYNSTLKRLQ